MTRQEINTELFRDMTDFNNTALRQVNDKFNADDLLMSVVEYFLGISDERVFEIFEKDGIKGLKNYVGAAITRSGSSAKSNYYYSIRKENREYQTDIATYSDEEGRVINPLENIAREEDNTLDELSEMLQDILENEIDWYGAKLLKMHKIEGMGLSEIQKLTGISRNSIFRTCTKTLAKVRTIAKQREMEKQRLDDYGILSTQEYNDKYRMYMTPDVSFYQLKTLLEESKGDKTVAMSYFDITYEEVSFYCKKWNINITKYSHISKEMIENALDKHDYDRDKTAVELMINRAALSSLITKYEINTNKIEDFLLS